MSSTRYSSELTDSPVSSPKCIELTESAASSSMLTKCFTSSSKYNNDLVSASDSMSRYSELMANCLNYNLKNNTSDGEFLINILFKVNFFRFFNRK